MPKSLSWTIGLLSLVGMWAPHAALADTPRKGKVLIVVSSTKNLTLKNGVKHPTGFFLNELGIPLKALLDAGYEPVVADPLGNAPVMDTISDKPTYFGHDIKEYDAVKAIVDDLPAMKNPKKLSEIAAGDLSQYEGIFVPGGHAPMENLWKQPALGKILRYFHEHHKPTALICHGPIALLAAADTPEKIVASLENQSGTPDKKKNSWCYAGYKMTVFSDAEEKPNEGHGALNGFMLFYPEDALKAAGGELNIAPPKQSHVVVDRELITGQNPSSDKELADHFLKALKDAKATK